MVRDNRIVRIEGDWEGAVNHGLLCEHGRYDPVTESRNASPLRKSARTANLNPSPGTKP
jgi:predicted molibdopterin-dependent oxidoreductase YjgC